MHYTRIWVIISAIANSGQAALERIESRIPSLILLDVIMPVMNGFEVCEKIKKNEKTAIFPFLCYPAYLMKKTSLKV